MSYIDRITIHNFKSFKHATIQLSKGFNCIIGPNGSGKSNVCDSMLFALGESSLKRMRASSVRSFINSSASTRQADHNVNRTYVSVHLATDDMSFTRIIKSNNKIGYRLNSKRITRQEMLDALRLSSSHITSANTITQDEITKMINLNPKERRSLIEIAAGIKQFNDKKEASLAELQKVEEHISNARIQLSERAGFLKELKREKEDAELYTGLRDSIRSATYTILKTREQDIEREYRGAVERQRSLQAEISSIKKRIGDADAKVRELSESRVAASNRLNKRSLELSKTNRELESLNRELAVIESKLEANITGSVKAKGRLESLEREMAVLSKRMDGDASSIETLRKDLKPLAKELESTEYASDTYDESAWKGYESNKRFISEMMKGIEDISTDIEEMRLEVNDKENQKRNAESALEEARTSRDASRSELSKKDASKVQEGINRIRDTVNAVRSDISSERAAIQALDSKVIDTREAIAVHGGDLDSTTELLKGKVLGVYGRVYELCKYDDKYSNAVSAACGSRLNYIVVDSVDTAKKAISLLKSKKLGRSSFIPLSDIKVGRLATAGTPLISVVEYDGKFSKAMEFVFSNTYLVESIDEAKRDGFGSRRYVTISGELIEPSGVITGGTLRPRLSVAKLRSDLSSFNDEKAVRLKRIAELEERSEATRGELGRAEVTLMSVQSSSSSLRDDIAGYESEIVSLEGRINSLDKDIASITDSLKKAYLKKSSITREMSEKESENQSLYESMARGVESPNSARNAETQRKRKELQSNIERVNMDIASLTKETEMFGDRLHEMSAEKASLSKEMSELSSSRKVMQSEKERLSSSKAELADAIKGHDSVSARLYKEISELESSISKAASEKGALSNSLQNGERSLMEVMSTISQSGTRLSDIKAELADYQGVIMTEGTIPQLEDKLSSYKANIEKLGNVNMRAPEMYEMKSKDVLEAEERVSVLESEKNSILNMIQEIESKKLSVFTETFEAVNRNFGNLYSQISEGEATLVLADPKSPFDSGLSVRVKYPHGKHEMIESKSGGEKSMLMILLILSIQIRKPMSFYIFDEIDMSLDKQNSKKLSLLFKNLSERSQFIVVSHNDTLISNAGTVIGITKLQGESKAVGVQLLNKAEVQTA